MDSQNAVSSSASQNQMFLRATEYILRATTGRIDFEYRPGDILESHSLHKNGLWIGIVALSGQGITLDVFPTRLNGKKLSRCFHHIHNQRELAAAVADYDTCRQSDAWAHLKDLSVLAVLDGLLHTCSKTRGPGWTPGL